MLWLSSTSTKFYDILIRFYSFIILSLLKEFSLHSNFKLTFHRFLFILFLLLFFPCLLFWNLFGYYLDDLLYSKWYKQQIIKPIFIIGNARSGTTWLHRLLINLSNEINSQNNSQNNNNKKNENNNNNIEFLTFKTWEIIFAPSITWKLLFYYIYSIDLLFYSPLFRLIKFIENYIIIKSDLHEIGLNMAEEDEWLMTHISLAQLMCFFFPCGGDVLGPLIAFDTLPESDPNSLSKSYKHMIFNFYKQCIQRHIYTHIFLRKSSFLSSSLSLSSFLSSLNQFIFISKNPAFTLRIKTLYEIFPDCKIICLLRDPVESIPSMVSYIGAVSSYYTSFIFEYLFITI